ncbi:MAG: hypothetical protein IKY02_03455, partial [Lachnospiraceae bacterium]|nr:hypothetical protein [Lachnospiraceae bacterium]
RPEPGSNSLKNRIETALRRSNQILDKLVAHSKLLTFLSFFQILENSLKLQKKSQGFFSFIDVSFSRSTNRTDMRFS